ETRAEEDGSGKHRDEAAFEIEAIHSPRIHGVEPVIAPPRQYVGDRKGGPGNGGREENLAGAETRYRSHATEQPGRAPAAERDAREKDGEDDGEYVNRPEQEHAKQTRPDGFRAQGDGARQSNRYVDGAAAP